MKDSETKKTEIPIQERAYSDFRMMNKGTIQTDRVADEFHAAITEFLDRRDLRCMPGNIFVY